MLPTDELDSPAEEEQAPQGYCIEVCVMADGTISVAGPSELDGDEQGGQPAESIGEALKAVLAIYKSASAGPTEDDQMASGFNSVRGSPSGA